MQKVNLSFDMPEDKDELKAALYGKDFYFACLHFDNYLREQIKNYSDNMSDEQLQALERIREEFNDIVSAQTDLDDWANWLP